MEETKKKSNADLRREYFSSLDNWVKANAFFPFFLMQNYLNANPSAPAPVPPTNVNVNISALRILSEEAQANLLTRVGGGYEFVLAPFSKRAVAEMIDIAILLVIKVMLTFLIITIFDIDLGFEIDRELLQKTMGDDDFTGVLAATMGFFGFSSDLYMLEFITRGFVCLFEAFCTRFYGATPGKAMLNLRIMYVEALAPLQPPQQRFRINRQQIRALVYPAEKPSLDRALIRALAKNVIMTLLFPVCFIMIFFKNNRTAYDILTKTVVVEHDPNPPHRRRTQLL